MTTSAPEAPASTASASESSNGGGMPIIDVGGATANYESPSYDYGDPTDDDEQGGSGSAAPPAPGAAAPSAAAPKAEEFAAELLAGAEVYGLDKANFADSKSLQAAVDAMDRQFAAAGRASLGTSAPAAPAAPQAPAAPNKPAPQSQGQVTRFDFSKLAENYDPEFVAALKQVDEYHEQRYAALEQRFQSVEERYRQADEAATEQRIDGFFEGLGEEFASLFGKGPGGELKSESAELKERGKVLEAADMLCAGYASKGLQPPSEDVLLMKALRLVHGDKIEQHVTKRISNQVRDRRGQFAARPTQQSPKPPSGDAHVIRKIGEKMKALGYGDGTVADEPEDNDDSRY